MKKLTSLDIVVIVLSIGGTALSITTLLPALRRLRRHGRAWGRWARPVGCFPASLSNVCQSGSSRSRIRYSPYVVLFIVAARASN